MQELALPNGSTTLTIPDGAAAIPVSYTHLVVRGEIKATLNKTSSATFEIGGVVGQCGGATTLNQVVSYVNVTSTNNNDGSRCV